MSAWVMINSVNVGITSYVIAIVAKKGDLNKFLALSTSSYWTLVLKLVIVHMWVHVTFSEEIVSFRPFLTTYQK
jgi:hypothetical protein